MSRKTPVILTYKEKNRIDLVLRDALDIVEANDDMSLQKVRYKVAGQSDETIAFQVGGRTEPGHVQSLRQSLFGVLYHRGPTGAGRSKEHLRSRIVGLESDVQSLLGILTDVFSRISMSHPEHARLVRKYQQGE